MAKITFITSESVTPAHPDKTCDNISDAILDDLLKQDPDSRVAVECLTKTGMVIVAGEATTKGYADIQKITRRTLKEIGYTNPEFGIDYEDAAVLVALHEQSPDIAQGVNEGEGDDKEQGAGDQGMMYGYACDETPELMPLPITLAHKLVKKLTEAREKNEIPELGPDGKSQVTVEYHDGKPKRIDAVVISTQHLASKDMTTLRREIKDKVIAPVCGDYLDDNTKYHINPTGKFVIGGPEGDAGLTGRKIVVDTYGGVGRVGGGCFCLAGDALVNTEKGLLQIDECQEIGAKGLLVKTDVHPMPAGAWYDNGMKETIVLETKDGYTVEATPNHNFRVLNENGEYVWKSIEDIEENDWVPIHTKNRLFGDNTLPPFKYTYKEGTAEKRKKRYTHPKKLTKEYAYVLGLLIGDGYCTDRGSIRLCVCEDDMAQVVKSTYKKLFGVEGKIYGHWCYIGGVELRAYLKHLGLQFEKSYEKTVPKSIFSASKKNCAAFLRGLFDTDGCIRFDGRNKNTKRIHLATTSKKLAEQVQVLLLNFGIVSKIYPVTLNEKKAGCIKGRKITSRRTRYDLVLKGSQSIAIFAEEIGFELERKQKIITANAPMKRDLRTIPNQKERITRLFKKLPAVVRKEDSCNIARFTRTSRGKATKNLTYEKLKEFLTTYEQYVKGEPEFIYLQGLFYMGHYYTRVKRKIPSFAHTYDINIPFSHTFTSNGFVCHNSGKDPSKVDRSAAYAARYVAKNIVAAGLATTCEVQLSYAIGVAKPTSVDVDTFGTHTIPEEKIIALVQEHFDLTPKGIITGLDLKKPIYRQTAAYGHFGRAEFSWEKTDKASELKKDAGI